MQITTENIVEVFNNDSEYDFSAATLARVDWYKIFRCQKLSEKFIERFAERVNWSGISYIQKLTEKFIERFADRVNWSWISRCQKLSEKFIERFAERVDWYKIFRCQKLSEKFIERFAERVDWSGISCYQKLNRTFRTKFADKLQIPDASSNTLYWKIKQLKSLVASSPYKIINNEYIIAWKAICLDRTSLYNKLYTYEKGTIKSYNITLQT